MCRTDCHGGPSKAEGERHAAGRRAQMRAGRMIRVEARTGADAKRSVLQLRDADVDSYAGLRVIAVHLQ